MYKLKEKLSGIVVFSDVILLQGLGYIMQILFLFPNKYSTAPRSDSELQ